MHAIGTYLPTYLHMQCISIFLLFIIYVINKLSSFLFIQFYDLRKLFETSGEVPDTHYIFMVSERA